MRILPIWRVSSKPDMAPRTTAISRLVDAIAVGDIDADGGFAHASVDDVGVGFRQRQRADRGGVEVAVRDILPILPGVFGFPDAAGAGAEVEGSEFSGVAGDGDHASAAEGSDAAPASDVVKGEGHGVCFLFWWMQVGGYL